MASLLRCARLGTSWPRLKASCTLKDSTSSPPGSSTFGIVTTQANNQRLAQFALRLKLRCGRD
jgi:hypothetical protein